MYKLNIRYEVKRSVVPSYILSLVVFILQFFGDKKCGADERKYILERINEYINVFWFVERNTRRMGTLIRRDIDGEKMCIYSMTGKKKLLTVYFNEV
jgi:hypothetical protein